MGAPVVAFCRIDDRKIRVREPIAEPDAVVVQDPTLLGRVDVFGGLAAGGYALINSTKSVEGLGLPELDARIVTVPATDIAREHIGRPIPNVALLGALAGLTGCYRSRRSNRQSASASAAPPRKATRRRREPPSPR